MILNKYTVIQNIWHVQKKGRMYWAALLNKTHTYQGVSAD